ncbi:MAG TPA: PLDc N-terminal domain-containing protein [Flavisolibacter sp.]|jgi:uncharacterized membrane protein|nr:PLDc N-terminal domain-containing protein [Flavisolibacter sp.]
MKNTRHPNFILGLISFVIFLIGIVLRANAYEGGDYVIGAGIVLGAIHWIWAITDVLKDYRVRSASENRIIWVILVIIIPPIGGMLYYAMSKTVRM